MLKTTHKALADYLRAGYAGIYLTSHEESRVESELFSVATEIGFKLYTYTITDSLMGPVGHPNPKVWTNDKEQGGGPLDPVQLLE